MTDPSSLPPDIAEEQAIAWQIKRRYQHRAFKGLRSWRALRPKGKFISALQDNG